MAVTRGCGTRKKGGAYLTVKGGPNGRPLEHFMLCPPLLVDEQALGLKDVGVTLHPVGDTVHVFDIVGGEHYPNVADLIEEARRHGISRRIARSEKFGLLTAESRLILLHRRASIDNATDLWRHLVDESTEYPQEAIDGWRAKDCPRDLNHARVEPTEKYTATMCHALYFQDITGGDDLYDPTLPPRAVSRSIGETTYQAQARPEGFTPKYSLAAFASFPIHAVEVVRDPEDLTHLETVELASKSGLPVIEVDE